MEKIDVGFELAEIDLRLRGPGEIYGVQQHGFWGLKSASFTDTPLIEKTRKAAERIWPRLNTLPLLKERIEEGKMMLP
jgi:ATP-dependent DNA helicase RecG